jgi:beta-ureidopropionase / N-carbamoyl-L-amino-acid hydrolase
MRRIISGPTRSALESIAVEPPAGASATLRVNSGRLLDRLQAMAQIGRSAQGGVNRLAYTDADLEGREYVSGLMRAAGLRVSTDAAGNIIGRREGDDPKLAPLLAGSHTDSVPEGGVYDGTVGVLSAVEIAQTLAEHGVTLRHPLEVVVFQNEEEGLFGSRAMCGELSKADLDLASQSGKTIRDGIAFIGGDPASLQAARRRRGEVAAFLEYHIEQGPILEGEGADLGIVEGIVGVNRWEVTITGFTNHAGTTPMNGRKDALLAAAGLIEAVNRVVTSTAGLQVGTVGRIRTLPGAPNVIPGLVTLSLDLRDLDTARLDALYREIEAEASRIEAATGTLIEFKQTSVQLPALTDQQIQGLVAEASKELRLTTKLMRSGAGHDAQALARIAPVGMIFIPSVGGISHTPLEFSRPSDIANGANAYLHTLLKLDARLDKEARDAGA